MLCGHTFCKHCLFEYLQKSAIKCPICLKITTFPVRYNEERSIKTLTINYSLLEAVNSNISRLQNEEAKREDIEEFYQLNNAKRLGNL